MTRRVRGAPARSPSCTNSPAKPVESMSEVTTSSSSPAKTVASTQSSEASTATAVSPSAAASTSPSSSASTASSSSSASPLAADVADAVLRQVTFYFSDDNIVRDAFLRSKIESDTDGLVDVSLLMTFNRLRSLLPADATAASVASVLVDEPTLRVVGERVGRVTPFDATAVDDSRRALFTRSYPDKATWEEIGAYWSAYAPVSATRVLRSKTTKAFDGSAFVIFTSEADAKRALTAERAVYPGTNTVPEAELKADYLARRSSEKEKKRAAKPAHDDAAGSATSSSSSSFVPTNTSPSSFTPGRVLSFDASAFSERAPRDLRKAFNEALEGAPVEFVDVSSATGYARCATVEAAAELLKKKIVDGVDVTFTLVTGDDEKSYYERADRARASQVAAASSSGGAGRSNKRRRR